MYIISVMYNYLFKTVVIGDTGVGKTSLIYRLLNDKFNDNEGFTIGVDFGLTCTHINGHDIKVHIWDTAGQERFRAITNAYYRNVSGAIIVYDVNNITSFNNVNKWIELIKTSNPEYDIPIIIIGNKTDLHTQRKVSVEQGQQLASQHNVLFAETSAKLGQQTINSAFKLLINNIYTKTNTLIQSYKNQDKLSKTWMTDILTQRGIKCGTETYINLNDVFIKNKLKKRCC